MKANEVIRIGRSRSREASRVAWRAVPGLLPLLGELNDQDRVLARQTHQDHEADLGEDVHVHARPGSDADDRAEQAHRHHQDHGQRQRPAFVLGRQHQEDEDHRQDEDVDRRVALPGAAR